MRVPRIVGGKLALVKTQRRGISTVANAPARPAMARTRHDRPFFLPFPVNNISGHGRCRFSTTRDGITWRACRVALEHGRYPTISYRIRGGRSASTTYFVIIRVIGSRAYFFFHRPRRKSVGVARARLLIIIL